MKPLATKAAAGMAAVFDWVHLKDEISGPTDALGAVLHREKHPTKQLDGFSCECWARASWMRKLLEETGYEVQLIPTSKAAVLA